ncbi:cyclophilin-like domain-containing protein [Pelagophyceae sp. CCMP2097]|nr:cyclophilin-like domain-containing protein [Pelagophyceae sp. CCMP2097]
MPLDMVSRTLGVRKANPIVFFDISIGGEPIGRMTIELRADLAAVCAENFRALCTGEKGRRDDVVLHYKGSKMHRVVYKSHCQGGDLKYGDGTWSESSFKAGYFDDENFILRHTGPGVLSMCNKGPDTNGSQFLLHFAESLKFDERHVVFGCLADEESMRVLFTVERAGTLHGAPQKEVIIADCGQLYPPRK